MKFKLLTLSLLSASACLGGAYYAVPDAVAQCVMTDVSVQVAIRGSHRPAQQDNSVKLGSDSSCSGSAITQTNTQVYAGKADQVIQQRNSNQYLQGTGNSRTGVRTPTVAVPVQVKVDVYNPAYDDGFMHKLTPSR